MALACEPDLVVLDEPTTGLDVTTQEQIVDLLKDLRSRLRMSMLYVTHDLGVLAQIADRVGVMYAGHMVETAPTRELFAEPRHPYTRGLIASVPQIEKTARRSDIVLRGLLKREQLPVGCPFQPRCDFAEAECKQEVQVPERIGSDHEVACRRWREIARQESPAASSEVVTRVIHPEPILSVEEINLRYGGRNRWPWSSAPDDVVKELSFVIKKGETFALVGESGSGKSTIARAVAGLLAPSQGIIRFEGQALPGLVARRSRELRRRIQYIFQNPDASLNPRARVGAILSRPFEFFFAPDRATTKRKVTEALEDVRLDRSYSSRYPDQLSGGERQRVAIARALIADSKLLLCDEILSGLDVSVQANVLSLLQRLRREYDLSMLFISHDLAVVRSLADRVGVLFRGRLMEIGDVEDIFRPPFHPYTYELLMAVPSINRSRQARNRPRMNRVATERAGCVFAGRCQWQQGTLCEKEAPPWREVTSRHRIRCHIPVSELAMRAQEDLLHLGPPAAAASQ
jgi:peptide/nickel transport system ATP-binding protein